MIRRRPQQPPPLYRSTDGKLRDLTPIELLVLSAFRQSDEDERAQDALTVAGWLNGGRAFPRSHHSALERVAGLVLKDLVAMGFIVADDRGWLRLATPQPQTADSHELGRIGGQTCAKRSQPANNDISAADPAGCVTGQN